MRRILFWPSSTILLLGVLVLPACGQQDSAQSILADCGGHVPREKVDSCLERARVIDETEPSPDLQALEQQLQRRALHHEEAKAGPPLQGYTPDQGPSPGYAADQGPPPDGADEQPPADQAPPQGYDNNPPPSPPETDESPPAEGPRGDVSPPTDRTGPGDVSPPDQPQGPPADNPRPPDDETQGPGQ